MGHNGKGSGLNSEESRSCIEWAFRYFPPIIRTVLLHSDKFFDLLFQGKQIDRNISPAPSEQFPSSLKSDV